MPVGAIIILSLVIGMLVLFGVLIKYFKCLWLISGYNTLSESEKRNIDEAGLARFVGNALFVIAGILLMGFILNYYGIGIGLLISIGAIFLVVIYVIIGSQRYEKKTKYARDDRNIAAAMTVVIMVIVFVLITVVITNGAREPKVSVNADKIGISATYGIEIDMDDVKDVFLKDDIPGVISKTNGFDFGNILRGNFNVKGIGNAKLYIYRGKQPYIYIIQNKGMTIINFKDSSRTEQLYKEIEQARGKF